MKKSTTCDRCGKCCTELAFVFSVKRPMYELLKAHTGREVGSVKFKINHVCDQLGYKEDGTSFCRIYDERPGICRNFLCPKAKEGELNPREELVVELNDLL